jgi:NTP pyrophosphatase (non-canonical NTP hydrolase)
MFSHELLPALLKDFQKSVAETSASKGWDDEPTELSDIKTLITGALPPNWHESTRNMLAYLTDKANNKAESICLMHSELSEALEALRKGNPPDDKIPEFSGVEAELADVVIRILGFAERFNFDVIGAIFAKAEANKLREYKHGGKLF